MSRVLLFLSLFSLLFYAYNSNAEQNDIPDIPQSITVLASTSLTDVMTDLIRVYSIKGNISVSVVYDSPAELAGTIQQGNIADIYLSEDQISMRDLKRQGLIDVFSLTTLATNRLVLVAASDSVLSKKLSASVPLNDLFSDINEHTLLVIGDPDSEPVGMHAKLVIEELGHWDKIKNYTIRAASARNALYLIAKGKAAGIVYFTDAYNNKEVKIISGFPPTKHNFVVYQGAVVAGENMPTAREFLNFLKSDEAKKIFEKHGFSTI